MMELKGVLTRIQPLVKTQPAEYAKYVKTIRQLQQFNPESAQTKFLLAGPADIETEKDAQDLIARFTTRIDELRKVINEIKNGAEITLYINDRSFKEAAMKKAGSNCQFRQTSPDVFDWENCDFSSAYERKLNRADLEAIQQIVAGYQTYLTVLNAWDMSGIYSKTSQLNGHPKHDLQILFSNSDFGNLRENSRLELIPDLVKDAVVGVRYALQMQESLCETGTSSGKNRPGYLFEDGICVESTDNLKRALSLVELALKGPVVIAGKDPVLVDALSFFQKPLQSFREIEPLEFNSCGKLVQAGNGTLGGLFPNGDFNRIIGSAANGCKASADLLMQSDLTGN